MDICKGVWLSIGDGKASSICRPRWKLVCRATRVRFESDISVVEYFDRGAVLFAVAIYRQMARANGRHCSIVDPLDRISGGISRVGNSGRRSKYRRVGEHARPISILLLRSAYRDNSEPKSS